MVWVSPRVFLFSFSLVHHIRYRYTLLYIHYSAKLLPCVSIASYPELYYSFYLYHHTWNAFTTVCTIRPDFYRLRLDSFQCIILFVPTVTIYSARHCDISFIFASPHCSFDHVDKRGDSSLSRGLSNEICIGIIQSHVPAEFLYLIRVNFIYLKLMSNLIIFLTTWERQHQISHQQHRKPS